MVYRDLNMDDLQLKGCPCITKKVSKIMSITGQQIDYTRVGILRSQQHICSKKSGRPWYPPEFTCHTRLAYCKDHQCQIKQMSNQTLCYFFLP